MSLFQAPVLAKRKTKAMKEMEQASVRRAEARGKSAARRANLTQQFVIPDHTTTDFERQLKKIATRGGKCRYFPCGYTHDVKLYTRLRCFVVRDIESYTWRMDTCRV